MTASPTRTALAWEYSPAPEATDHIRLRDRYGLFINGEWQAARSGKTFDVINPATGQVIAKAAAGDAADIDLAVKAARKAFESGPWPSMPPTARAKLLWKLAEAFEANADKIAAIETLDNGMPFRVARMVVANGVGECLRTFAGWAGKINGETPTLVYPNHHAYTLREPVGVVERGCRVPQQGSRCL